MGESDHGWDKGLDIPVFSLYGESRKPPFKMFDRLDVLLVDPIDVDTRGYTFIYTLAYCLEAAARFGKTVMVLDRPNPLGGLGGGRQPGGGGLLFLCWPLSFAHAA